MVEPLRVRRLRCRRRLDLRRRRRRGDRRRRRLAPPSGQVKVDAHHVGDGNKVTADATIGSGGGIASFAVAIALATDGGRVQARLDGDVTTTGTGVESVKVTANGNNDATADTLIISGGLFSGAGAGAVARAR